MTGIRRLADDELREEAARFLKKYNRDSIIPIPIEEIAEIDMGIEIVPIPGLHGRIKIEGGLSLDLTRITVDQFTFEQRVNRYRFTVAHELGHLVLHGEYIRALNVDSLSSWKAAVQNANPSEYGMIEYQAYQFAGCVLVPCDHLLRAVAEATAVAEKNGIDLTVMGIEESAHWIASRFEVSTDVIQRRLRNEKIV